MPPPALLLALAGSCLAAASVVLAALQPLLGTPLFFTLAGIMAVMQAVALAGTRGVPPRRALLVLAFLFAVAARIPLAVGPVAYDSDMIRYIWDGRVQRLGLNPYAVLPADPAMAYTHDDVTVRMPSRNARTPYPPAAQLFFRAIVTVSERPQVMKLALTLCDVLTILLLWRWLVVTGRNEWLALWYAWSPLVILEVAHSGHIDALGALWIMASAYWLTRGRTALASMAFTLAVTAKLLPLVLAPLYLGRVRVRDIALGGALLGALYLPFAFDSTAPIGAIPNVVQHIRFNSPVFRPLAWVITPQGAAVVALLAGFAAAAWARLRLQADDPAAWAWPMAAALACAPVIYPWYLLYLTPFLFARSTFPLAVWSWAVIPVYIVWERARHGARWVVPNELMVLEYGAVLAAIGVVLLARRSRRPVRSAGERVPVDGAAGAERS